MKAKGGSSLPPPYGPRGRTLNATALKRRGNILVLIADDHPLFRAGMKMALQGSGISVVGEASNGEEAVQLAQALNPDVAILDVRMPGMDGLQAMKQIKATCLSTAVVLITSYENTEFLWDAFLHGAAAYLLKGSTGEGLAVLVRRVADGDRILDEGRFAELLAESGQLTERLSPRLDAPPVRLTSRERQILALMKEDLANEAIAQRAGIKLSTVKSHIHSVFQKIGVTDRTQALLWATLHGIFPPQSRPEKKRTRSGPFLRT